MEIFDVVDEHGIPNGETVERSRAHREGIRHRTAHVWVVREMGGRWQVLLQKRSENKDSFPGRLDTSSAGHIPAGSEPVESALRELKEELGVEAAPEELTWIGQFKIQYELPFHGAMFRDNEVSNVYVLRRAQPASEFVIQKEELEAVEWRDADVVAADLARHDPAYCVPHGGWALLEAYLKSH